MASFINHNQFEQAFLLEQALESMESRNFSQAIFYCQKSSQYGMIKSVLGVIQMYSNNFVQAIDLFQQGLEVLEQQPINGKDRNQSMIESVAIKLYGNLLLSYILTNRSNEAIQLLNKILKWILTTSSEKDTFEQLVYILFRVSQLDSVGSIVTSGNQLFDEPTKACVLSATSFNLQILNRLDEAYETQLASLKIWRQIRDSHQTVFSLRRLVCLATQLKLEDELDHHQNELGAIMEENFGQLGVERTTLFKGYRQKMKTMKEVIKALFEFDNEHIVKNQAVRDQMPECWKLAAKLKLYKTIKEMKSTTTPKGKENMNQIKYILDCANKLENEGNKLIEKEIKRSSFVKASINLLSNHLTNLVIHFGKLRITMMKHGLSQLMQHKPKQRLALQRISIDNMSKYSSNREATLSMRTRTPTASRQCSRKESFSSRSPFHSSSVSVISIQDQRLTKKVSKYLRMCEVGQFLQKKNFSNDSGQMKYVKVTKNEIRWAGDADRIDKESKYHSYNLKEVRGILYGKFSETFKKSSSKSLDSWKCFSLVLQKRTLDFYSDNEAHVQFWITGISAALKRVSQNQDIILYTPGRQRWRKMFLKLTQAFIDPMKKQERLHHHDVAQAIILFGRHNYKLPKS